MHAQFDFFRQAIVFFAFHISGVLLTSATLSGKLPHERARYAGKNLWKAMILAAFTPQACRIMFDFMEGQTQGVQYANDMATLSLLYATLDAVGGIILGSSLSLTTAMHHMAVLSISFKCVSDPVAFMQGSWAGFAWYGALSCVAWPVNAYLGGRLLLSKGRWGDRAFAALAFSIYTASCALNWVWQARVFVPRYDAIQVALMGAIVLDDLMLMKFLAKKTMNIGMN